MLGWLMHNYMHVASFILRMVLHHGADKLEVLTNMLSSLLQLKGVHSPLQHPPECFSSCQCCMRLWRLGWGADRVRMCVQDMLKQWICATTGKVLFTPKGRAFNRAAPALGATANTAFLSLLYGQSRSRFISQEKSNRYTCFARSQVWLQHQFTIRMAVCLNFPAKAPPFA